MAAVVLAASGGTTAAAVTQTTYQIFPGGQYTYKPSPRVGIPGGAPSDYQLDFGIGGTFVYELDTAGPAARLLNLDLTLSGNEAIQAEPPQFAVVTAERVEEYLASHTFVEDFIGGLLHLESSQHPGLKLTDGLNGNLAISGGFDATPVDGTARRSNSALGRYRSRGPWHWSPWRRSAGLDGDGVARRKSEAAPPDGVGTRVESLRRGLRRPRP